MALRDRRILLVAGVPPCTNYSGGLFLDQIVRASQPLAGAFIVQNRHLAPAVPEDVSVSCPIKTILRMDEWHPRTEHELSVRRHERQRIDVHIPDYRKQLLEFAAEIEATDIWFILEGQTLISLAHSILDVVDLPLRVQVMDPPGWWLREHNIDGATSEEVLRKFHEVVERASSCAAASFAMKEAYEQRYRRTCVTLMPSLDIALSRPPAPKNSASTLKIGFAGQTYANEEFNQLVLALHEIKRDGRYDAVELHAFTQGRPVDDDSSLIRYHGWTNQTRLIEELSQLDLLYCPYWFSEKMREETMLSFPSKLTTYLATGRPVLFHGRVDASPGQFLRRNAAAFFCFSHDATALRRSIERAMAQADLYADTASNGSAAFARFLTNDCLQSSFEAFMATATPNRERHGKRLVNASAVRPAAAG